MHDKRNSNAVQRKPKLLLFLNLLCTEILIKKLICKLNFYETTLAVTMFSVPICTLNKSPLLISYSYWPPSIPIYLSSSHIITKQGPYPNVLFPCVFLVPSQLSCLWLFHTTLMKTLTVWISPITITTMVTLQDFRFSQCCWTFKSSGMLCYVTR